MKLLRKRPVFFEQFFAVMRGFSRRVINFRQALAILQAYQIGRGRIFLAAKMKEELQILASLRVYELNE